MEELSLEELRHVEIDLLKKVDEFCHANGIKYYIHGGTLLGAVRHKGFIPWDDDMDISMPSNSIVIGNPGKIIPDRPDATDGYCHNLI